MPYCTITKAQCCPHISWHSPAWRMSMSTGKVLRLQPGKLLRSRLSIS
ncbi:hypothetical protein C8C92_3368 [Janthinobacterium sp. 78]|nr:hypothetical protein C8C92_3368 [Janthinobacterium sp. 78]